MIFSLPSQKQANRAVYAFAVLHIVQYCNRAQHLEAVKICSKTTGQFALLGAKYRRQHTTGENKNKLRFQSYVLIY